MNTAHEPGLQRAGRGLGGSASLNVQTLPIRFTGSGSEYFRIWIVNLLLILVSFTLYWPFARARRIAYFQNNTVVGEHPLGFHADPWKMFRGYIVIGGLGLAYSLSAETMPLLATSLLLLGALAWPALWRASLQFRLRNTSWRGVRLNFDGDMKGAYLAYAPLLLPVLVLCGLGVVAASLPADGKPSPEQGRLLAVLLGVAMLLFVGVMPWCFARIKRYQHGGYRFAGERTELRAGVRAFYGLGFRAYGVLLGGFVALLLTGWLLLPLRGTGFASVFLVLIALAYLVVPLLMVPYVTVSMQNLIWPQTRSRQTRFRSELRFGAYARLNALQWLLIGVTLGLYWPFAQVRLTRMRLEAMSLQVKGSVNDWLAQAATRQGGALGDAAGDFFGIDLGL